MFNLWTVPRRDFWPLRDQPRAKPWNTREVRGVLPKFCDLVEILRPAATFCHACFPLKNILRTAEGNFKWRKQTVFFLTRAPFFNSIEIVRPLLSWYLPLVRNAWYFFLQFFQFKPWVYLRSKSSISFPCLFDENKNRDFPISTEVASGFGILKYRDDPDEIGLVFIQQ